MSGAELKARRLALHLTQQMLAELICVNVATLASWENGDARVPGSVRMLVILLQSPVIRRAIEEIRDRPQRFARTGLSSFTVRSGSLLAEQQTRRWHMPADSIDIAKIAEQLDAARDHASQIEEELSALDRGLKTALELLVGPDNPDDPDDPDDPDEPDGPVTPVEGWEYTLENLPGGPVGSNGRNVVPKKTFTEPSWMKQANTDLEECRILGSAATDSQKMAPNIRLINCTIEDNKGHTVSDSGNRYIIYLNPGLKEIRLNFVMFGGKVIGCSGVEFMESKGQNPAIINVDFSGSPGIIGGIRVRHGLEALIVGCKGLKRVDLRGHNHAAVNCQNTVARVCSGSLPGNIKEWLPLRGKQGLMQRAECCYVAGVRKAIVGFYFGHQTQYPALATVVAPSQSLETKAEQGMTKRLLKSFNEVQELRK